MRILLLTPPMTQLNTPYPATAYLTGFLRKNGYEVSQADPALELVLRLFSQVGLKRIAAKVENHPAPELAHFLVELPRYLATVESVVRFLQNQDPSLALRIV